MLGPVWGNYIKALTISKVALLFRNSDDSYYRFSTQRSPAHKTCDIRSFLILHSEALLTSDTLTFAFSRPTTLLQVPRPSQPLRASIGLRFRSIRKHSQHERLPKLFRKRHNEVR